MRTNLIQARSLKVGSMVVTKGCEGQTRVKSVSVCGDGSIRVQMATSEQRMTGSVLVRIVSVH